MNRSEFIQDKGRPHDGCPKCGGDNRCPCAACAKNGYTKPDDVTYKWTEDGESMTCGHCGFTALADVWMDQEYEYYKSRGFFGNPE